MIRITARPGRALALATALATALTLGAGLAGCVSQEPAAEAAEAAAEQESDATSAATGDWEEGSSGAKSDQSYQDGSGWSVSLKGVREAELYQSYFDDAKKHASHYVEKVVEKKGVKTSYRGMPLRLAIAMVDGTEKDHAWLFDEQLWAAGYDVTLIAKDGYSATFNTKDLAPGALVIADLEDGKPIAPMIVGDSLKNLWVRDLARIETSLAPSALVAAAASFSLDIDINGAKASFSLAELEKLPIYTEGRGAYTTSAGTRYEGVYGGVRLLDLLRSYAEIAADDSVTFVAMDGYEMSYPGKTVLDSKDGEWLLAFRLDGDYLPKDPGYVRTIKVGPGTPNVDGHLSVRMVKKIVVKQKDFVDFELKLSGKMAFDLDRSTVQSCVSCHKRTVTFEKKGEVAEYTGFPLWLLLGYVDDAKYAPHKQDASIAPYSDAAADAGYAIDLVAADGFKVSVDSREVTRNDDLIVAMYKNGEKLPAGEAPLVLVWDRAAKKVPAGVKNIKMLASVGARF
ncbi:MAG: molybdopterin-dependent oxidoreductase [Spirochaetes bacterium]|nr:molybdopterin-dependent oxidoreductase [Spirochaetota bacterium]MBU1081091.1 molybdopterin-dependent oxidoreductase [Spirochaetota bacterium]